MEDEDSTVKTRLRWRITQVLESLLHSNPSNELWMEALGESEWKLLEWRRWALSTVKTKSQERRVVGDVWVYIELSQESSRWAKIQILDNVWLGLSVVDGGYLR
jgi:hypothetical protein